MKCDDVDIPRELAHSVIRHSVYNVMSMLFGFSGAKWQHISGGMHVNNDKVVVSTHDACV